MRQWRETRRRERSLIVGYCFLLLYLLMAVGQTLHLYYLGSPDWHVLDWTTILIVLVILTPGLPGLLLIFPSRFLTSPIALLCRIIGVMGMLMAIVWGFIFSPEWWIIPLLALPINWAVHREYRKQRVIV